jgi:hypothetical protein
MYPELLRNFRFLTLAVALLALTASNLLSPGSVAWADVGELPEPGGLATPGDKTDDIRMASERVVFAVKPNDGTFEETGVEYYAHVTADFVMQNLASRAVSKELFFPFHSSLELGMFQDPLSAGYRQAKNARVLVEGVEVPVRYAELALSSQEKVIAAVFRVDFPAGEETAIQIAYDIRAVYEAKSPLLGFRYLMETGSHWAGTIGSGEVRFEFWRPIYSKAAIGRANPFFALKDGNLEWRFAELEPDRSHNIAVTFDPSSISEAEPETTLIPSGALTVQALIDGRSQLVVREDSVYWHHLDFAAPGRWLDPETQTAHDEPTYLNGGAWYPLWPDQPDRENRDCGCDSSSAGGNPPLAQQSQTAEVSIEQGRGQVAIVQQPEAGNDFTLIVEFDDNPQGGAYWYEVTLQYVLSGTSAVVPGDCAGPNLLHNGDFEQGFDDQGVGLGWGSFHTEGGAAYGFRDDQWPAVVYQGLHSQGIGIASQGTSPAADRFAGIYQTVSGLEPGAAYALSIVGLMREEATHPGEDPYRYMVQWAYSSEDREDWTRAAGWQDLPWHEISLRTDPGAFSTYETHLVAPGQPLTLFIRAWRKWATPGRELDVNLDAITLRRCGSSQRTEP